MNSYYEAWSYMKKEHKNVKAYRKSVYRFKRSTKGRTSKSGQHIQHIRFSIIGPPQPLVYPTNTSSNQEQQPRHENSILYIAVWQIYRDTEQPHKKKTSQNKSGLQFSWRQYQQQIKCKSFNPIWKRNSSPQEEAYQLFLKNRPIHFHIDSTSFIRPVKQNLLSFIIKRITKSLIIFKKPRKITKDFFNDYIFVYTFQWTSSECFINVTITVNITMAKEIISHLSRFLKNG